MKLGPKKDIKGAVLLALPPPDKLMKGKKPDMSAPDEEDDSGMGLRSAMGDLSRALKAGDTEGAAAAFKDAVGLCKSYEEE